MSAPQLAQASALNSASLATFMNAFSSIACSAGLPLGSDERADAVVTYGVSGTTKGADPMWIHAPRVLNCRACFARRLRRRRRPA
jgi:hypothetical protein